MCLEVLTVETVALRDSFSVAASSWDGENGTDGGRSAPAGVILGGPSLFWRCDVKNNLPYSYHTWLTTKHK